MQDLEAIVCEVEGVQTSCSNVCYGCANSAQLLRFAAEDIVKLMDLRQVRCAVVVEGGRHTSAFFEEE